MAWIETIKPQEADDNLRELMAKVCSMYPKEYETKVRTASPIDESIVESHTLIPPALYHIFAGYAEMLSPDLPLTRRQHEMIATMVSVTNDCHY